MSREDRRRPCARSAVPTASNDPAQDRTAILAEASERVAWDDAVAHIGAVSGRDVAWTVPPRNEVERLLAELREAWRAADTRADQRVIERLAAEIREATS